MINEQIRDKQVRLISKDGEQLGLMSAKDAYMLARQNNLDLVKIAPQATPPVCKIVDYGKYKYEIQRREKEARKKQKVINVKKIRMLPNIEEKDFNTKMKQAGKFLEKGDKVKVTVRFRGRELAHVSVGKKLLSDFAEGLSEIAQVEKQPKMEGKNMIMFLNQKR